MPTVIRMKRGGRTHAPYYRVVVMDSRTRTRGRELDQLGIYHPCARPEPRTEIDTKKALDWLTKGAQPSDTARNLLSKKGIMAMFAQGVKPEDVQEEAPAVEAEVAAEAETEAPAEAEAEA